MDCGLGRLEESAQERIKGSAEQVRPVGLVVVEMFAGVVGVESEYLHRPSPRLVVEVRRSLLGFVALDW